MHACFLLSLWLRNPLQARTLWLLKKRNSGFMPGFTKRKHARNEVAALYAKKVIPMPLRKRVLRSPSAPRRKSSRKLSSHRLAQSEANRTFDGCWIDSFSVLSDIEDTIRGEPPSASANVLHHDFIFFKIVS